MHRTVDTSELSEPQKLALVEVYFDELARIYKRRADTAREEGEPISDLVDVMDSKENDVLKLKHWVSAIIQQHQARKMVDALNQPAPRREGFDMVMGAEALVGLLGKAKVEAERLMGSFRETRNTAMVEHAREIATGLETVLFILQRLTYPGSR